MAKKSKAEKSLEKSYKDYNSDPKNVRRERKLTNEMLQIACLGDCEEKQKKSKKKNSKRP